MFKVKSPLMEAALEGSTGGAVPANGQGGKAPKKPSEAVSVALSDGRTVEFAGKKRMLKESLFPEGGLPQIRLDFRNGETRLFQIPPELLNRFAAHGAEQKLGDETAGEEDVDDMVLSIDALIERLDKFEWSVTREGGGMSGTSVLLKALVELSGKTVDQIKAFLKDKKPAEKMALRASAKVKPIVDRIESEKASKLASVDTDALLAGLEAA